MILLFLCSTILNASSAPSDLQLKIEYYRARYLSPDLASTRVRADQKRALLDAATQPALRRLAWRLVLKAPGRASLPSGRRRWTGLQWLPEVLTRFTPAEPLDHLVKHQIALFYYDLFAAVAAGRSDLDEEDVSQVLLSFNRVLRTLPTFSWWNVTEIALSYGRILGPKSRANVGQQMLVIQGLHALAARFPEGSSDRIWVTSLIAAETFPKAELRDFAADLGAQKTGTNCTEEILPRK